MRTFLHRVDIGVSWVPAVFLLPLPENISEEKFSERSLLLPLSAHGSIHFAELAVAFSFFEFQLEQAPASPEPVGQDILAVVRLC